MNYIRLVEQGEENWEWIGYIDNKFGEFHSILCKSPGFIDFWRSSISTTLPKTYLKKCKQSAITQNLLDEYFEAFL